MKLARQPRSWSKVGRGCLFFRRCSFPQDNRTAQQRKKIQKTLLTQRISFFVEHFLEDFPLHLIWYSGPFTLGQDSNPPKPSRIQLHVAVDATRVRTGPPTEPKPGK